MNNIQECKYFSIIKKQKILFKIFDPINGSYLIKEIFVENYFPNDTYNLLEKFLEKNIFEIEKELKDFIKKIYIIFESDSFFEVGSSFKHNFKGINFDNSQLNDSLLEDELILGNQEFDSFERISLDSGYELNNLDSLGSSDIDYEKQPVFEDLNNQLLASLYEEPVVDTKEQVNVSI